MDIKTVYEAIVAGSLDDHLNDVVEAINTRRQIQARQARAELKLGSRVRIKPRARRFAGEEGTLVRKLQKNVEIELLSGMTLRAHPSLVEEVTEEDYLEAYADREGL